MLTKTRKTATPQHRTNDRQALPFHPCMHAEAHETVGRLHLPVAPKCNIQCIYCRRDSAAPPDGEDCPGVAERIVSPCEALAKTDRFLDEWGADAVVGIAGPGDPLANPETFDTLALVRNEHPSVRLCLCTNGLALPHSIDALADLGLRHLSVTVNGVSPSVVARIHPWINEGGRIQRGESAARRLIENQSCGIEAAVARGMHVKINSVVVPGVNADDLEAVAEKTAALGASIINLMPLIPRGHLAKADRPSPCIVGQLKARCSQHLPIFQRCKQCRADAEGVPGKTVCTARKDNTGINRRRFLKASGLALVGALSNPSVALAADFKGQKLQVWSCGGLAEAFMPLNRQYEEKTGCTVSYTGAFAAALGKSLLGSAQTEVFAPRVLGLAQKLKAQGKMLRFWPLCFTKYVIATPRGNPAGITGIDDLAKPGVRTVLSPKASPPGGKAAMAVLKKAGVLDGAQKNAVRKGDCVQRDIVDIVSGAADAAIVELRITRLPKVVGKVEVIDIPEKFIPAKPVPFVIGIMKWASNEQLARNYVDFVLSETGQALFDAAGFIPARSEEGQRLVEKYGVKDV